MYEVNTLKQNITVFIIRVPAESDETWTIRPVGQVKVWRFSTQPCLSFSLLRDWGPREPHGHIHPRTPTTQKHDGRI